MNPNLRNLSFICLFLVGCGPQQDNSAWQAENAKLSGEIVSLKLQMADLEKRIAQIESIPRISPTDYDEASYAAVSQPSDPRWVLGRTSFGKFAVSVQSLTAKGAGTIAVLNVLNLSSVTIDQVQFSINYNQYTLKEGLALIGEGKTPTIQDEVTYQSEKSFPPGVWVTQVVVLPELPPEKIKFMSVKFDGSSIRASGQN